MDSTDYYSWIQFFDASESQVPPNSEGEMIIILHTAMFCLYIIIHTLLTDDSVSHYSQHEHLWDIPYTKCHAICSILN